MPAVLPRRVTIVEVGPRDGLQNEAVTVPTNAKVGFVAALAAAGLPVIEATAFVSPKWVPQMVDAVEVFRRLERRPGTRYTALVPNLKGLARALEAGLDEVAVFGAASETFSRRNINQSIDDSFRAFEAVCEVAARAGVRVRGYLSTAFGCPFEGFVAPHRVAELSARFVEMGCFEVSISDTIGIAHPGQVPEVVGEVLTRVPLEAIALHFHDTRGMALANVMQGLTMGVATFDASAGGLGGCPYAPGATGNLATEDLVYALDGLGVETGVDLARLLAASEAIEPLIGHPLPSRVYQAWKSTGTIGVTRPAN